MLFCKLYDFAKFISGDELYHWSAMCGLSAFLSINLFTFITVIKVFVLKQYGDLFSSKYYMLTILLPVGVIMYFLTLKNDRYKSMYSDYEKNLVMKGSIGTILTLLYVILTFAIPMLIGRYLYLNRL